MENGEAKELICMTHGHEERWENDGEKWVQGLGEIASKKKGQL